MAKLFYIIGPKGAGKDALARYVRPRLNPKTRILFAHRYITRPDHLGSENYIYLTEQEFLMRAEAGLFAMQWTSRNLRFGVGKEVMDWMTMGFSVMVQGSRHHLPTASALLGPDLVPLLVTVHPDILHERRLSELRERPEAIQSDIALEREIVLIHPNLIRLENNGPIDIAGERLLSLLHATSLQEDHEDAMCQESLLN
jgi:ribose 1,5-bisphosphokinase